jgi:hypothetical protein
MSGSSAACCTIHALNAVMSVRDADALCSSVHRQLVAVELRAALGIYAFDAVGSDKSLVAWPTD